METITVPAAEVTQLLAYSPDPRWVTIAVEGSPIRIQYEGGDGSTLGGEIGEPVQPYDKVALEGAPAANAIYAIGLRYAARVTVQTGPVPAVAPPP